MNINSSNLRKNYDALAPDERYAAIWAAITRNDEAERRALADSTPTKAWAIPNTYGLEEAWHFIASWFVMSQASDAVAFFMALQMDGKLAEATEGEAFDMMTKLQVRILARAEAWRALCDECKLDPEKMLEDYPGFPILDITELLMTAANGGELADRAAVEAELEGMREVIAHYRAKWE